MKEGWEIKKLDDLCTIKGRIGYRGYTKQDLVEKGEGAITLSPSNIINNQFNLDKCTYISWFKYEESPEIMVFEGDILFVKTGSTYGKVALVENLDEKATINPQFVVFKDLKCDNRFLYYSLTTINFKKKVESIVGGAATPTLSQTNLGRLQIPIPPLPEQEQIVAILDNAFAAIDQAQANIEKNIENAKELFQSKLNEIFSQKGDGWDEKKFKDVCVLQRGFDLPKRLREHGEHPLVSSSGIIDTHVEAKVKAPGVVTGRSGSIGNLFFIEDDFWPLNTTLYIKDFKGNLEEYVYYLIKQFDLKRFSSGAGVPTLNRNFVHDEIVFSTNDIETQKQIVDRLNDLKYETETIESHYHQKLTNLDDLKKSILQKAFSGALTSTGGMLSLPKCSATTQKPTSEKYATVQKAL